MGIINAGTAVGSVVAPFLIGLVLYGTLVEKGVDGGVDIGWLGFSTWRWVYLVTGVLGLLWTIWWLRDYRSPEAHPQVTETELALISAGVPVSSASAPATAIPVGELLSH